MDAMFDLIWGIIYTWGSVMFYCGIFAVIVTTILFTPYFATLYLDNFTGTIVANNWIFFLLIFALLVFLKLFKYKTSNNFFVRTLFKFYLVSAVVYVFLYVFKFDAVIYSIIGAMDHYLTGSENVFVELARDARLAEVTNGHWIYNTLIAAVDKIIEFFKWSFGNVLAIDNSCFSATAETLNILKIIYTIFSYIVLGGFSILGTLLFSALLLAALALGVYIPYSAGFGVTNLINKLNYKYRFKKEYESTISKFLVKTKWKKQKKEA